MHFSELKKSILTIINSDKKNPSKLQSICDLLKAEVDYYNWVGFYFKNGDKNELKLAEFSGAPTEHVIIPFGKGICGQVAVSNQNFVVQNVEDQNNYISCGINVKSEIVIPIFVQGKNIGQIDIDSHSINPFSKEDEEFLEFICSKVATILDDTKK